MNRKGAVMPVEYLEHFLIQTTDIEGTKDWYCKVLGFEVGPSPNFNFPVYWLYLGGKDVIHLTVGGKNTSENRKKYLGQQSDATHGSGVVDHMAFRCSDLDGMLARMKEHKVEFNERQVNDQALYQVFLFDPNGVKIELNFDSAEAEGHKAEVVAEELEPAR